MITPRWIDVKLSRAPSQGCDESIEVACRIFLRGLINHSRQSRACAGFDLRAGGAIEIELQRRSIDVVFLRADARAGSGRG